MISLIPVSKIVCSLRDKYGLDQPPDNFFQISCVWYLEHYNDVILSVMASQITSLPIVNSTVDSGPEQIKCQSSATLAFVLGIHRWIRRTKGQ